MRYKELASSIDSDYLEFIKQKGNEEVKNIDDTFTMDEYADIVEVNASNDVEINNTLIPAIDFLDIVFNLFVKE